MKFTTLLAVTLVALTAPVVQTAWANASNECSVSQELDKYRYLRRLSLDLLNRAPSYEEYLALDNQEGVTNEAIDAMMEKDEFRLAMRRFHESLLWTNVANVSIADTSSIIAVDKKTGIYSVIGALRRQTFRKGTGSEKCGNFQQTEFHPDGSPIAKTATGPSGKEYQQDGWVEVTPYWAPETTIKVCAFDAQTALTGQKGPCDDQRSKSDQGCGCGPNLRHCYGAGGGIYDNTAVLSVIVQQLREQLLLTVDDHTVAGRPYSELLTTRTIYRNGPLLHWKKYLAHITSPNKTYNNFSSDDGQLPDIVNFADYTWQKFERSGLHAGIQTLGAFSLRFQTNRGRANRFRTVFTKQYFVPPATPTDTDCLEDTDDLTQKCTCRKCHQVLEPLAAHFGQIAEAGSGLLSDPDKFPKYNKICDPTLTKKVPLLCNRFYVIDKTATNPGALLAYQFASGDDPINQQIAANLESGPIGWANTIIDGGQFHSSMVRHLFEYLMGRDVILDPTRNDNEIDLLKQLANDFKAKDNFKTLVKTLVQLPQYRRVR